MSQNLEEIKDYARKNDVPIMLDEGMDFICDYIKQNNITSILEIGTAIGYSAIRFALLSPDINVTTVEIDIDRHIKALQNIKDCGLEGRINAINADALVADIDGKFDLIFIDAAKAQYINFFNRYKSCLKENGVIVSDNLSFHGMVEDITLTHNYSTIKLVRKIKKYVDFLKHNDEFDTVFYKAGDGVSISHPKKQITCYTVNVYNSKPYEGSNVSVIITQRPLDRDQKLFISRQNSRDETLFACYSEDRWCAEIYSKDTEQIIAVRSIMALFFIINRDLLRLSDAPLEKLTVDLDFRGEFLSLSLTKDFNLYQLKMTEEQVSCIKETCSSDFLDIHREKSHVFFTGYCALYSCSKILV